MPGAVNQTALNSATAVTDGGATETVVLTSNPVNVDTIQRRVLIQGMVDITPGSATATVTIRIRRTSLTGTLVATIGPIAGAAATEQPIPFLCEDQPVESAGLTYVVTSQSASASGNGTVNLVTITTAPHS